MQVEITLSLVIIILLILVFNEQVTYLLNATKTAVVSAFNGKNIQPVYNYNLPDDDDGYVEHLDTTPPAVPTTGAIQAPGADASDTLKALGYSGNLPWEEVLKATELSPSVAINHHDFVKDVRRFSSGSSFTSVNDEDQSWSQVNTWGFTKPEYIPIGPGARVVPSENIDTFKRNKHLRW